MKKNNFLYWLIIPLFFIVILNSVIFFLDLGSEKMTLLYYIIFLFIFLFAFLIAYCMRIKINKEYIVVIFGIGILKKKIKIKEISEFIEIVKIPWHYGIGFRYMKNSMLLSTRVGKCLKLKFLNQNKSVFIVPKDCNKIISIIKRIKNNN